MRYKIIIFDLDGTLLDTRSDLASSLNMALSANGVRTLERDTVISYVGNGARKLVERAIAGTGREQDLPQILEDYRNMYNDNCVGATVPYDGVPELLDLLRHEDVIVCCNTNKPEFTSRKLLDALLPGKIDYLHGQREGVPVKPDPSGVLACLKEYGLGPDECCYIGDSDVDIKTGHNAGVDVISVGWGFKTREFLVENGAGIICSNVKELSCVLVS